MKNMNFRWCLTGLLAMSFAVGLFCLTYAGSYDDTGIVDPSAIKEDNGKGIPRDKIRIGVLYISDPAVGAGYTYSHDIGIQEMQRNLGLKPEQIMRCKNVSDDDPRGVDVAVEKCVAAGCNIIFATSFGYMDEIALLSQKYPDVYFLHASGYKSNDRNFNNYFGRIYQPRYLSGIAAGMKTKSNRIGYVAAMGSTNAEVTGGIDAFAMGVQAVNPAARVYVKVTNSWFAPDKEKAAARELLENGCDVLSQHCDTSYPLELAEKQGAWGIGYNSDMRRQTPDSALVSVVWKWGAYYSDIVQKIIDGEWSGENYYGGMQEGIVAITELSEKNSPEARAAVADAEKRILNGELKIFTGQIETNMGSMVGADGHDFTDAEITSGIHWYFKNVEVLP